MISTLLFMRLLFVTFYKTGAGNKSNAGSYIPCFCRYCLLLTIKSSLILYYVVYLPKSIFITLWSD